MPPRTLDSTGKTSSLLPLTSGVLTNHPELEVTSLQYIQSPCGITHSVCDMTMDFLLKFLTKIRWHIHLAQMGTSLMNLCNMAVSLVFIVLLSITLRTQHKKTTRWNAGDWLLIGLIYPHCTSPDLQPTAQRNLPGPHLQDLLLFLFFLNPPVACRTSPFSPETQLSLRTVANMTASARQSFETRQIPNTLISLVVWNREENIW